MDKDRLEIFSDGVLAIIITIMVLELKVPHDDSLASLKPLIPVLVSYLLSFIYIGIYWINHHHLIKAVKEVDGGILWANLHLLFWLSLIPFTTGWMGRNNFAPVPEAIYGFVLLMAAIAYYILQTQILKNDKNSLIKKALGNEMKTKISPFIYAVAIVSTFFNQWIAGAIYVGVALMWLYPHKRIEKTLEKEET